MLYPVHMFADMDANFSTTPIFSLAEEHYLGNFSVPENHGDLSEVPLVYVLFEIHEISNPRGWLYVVLKYYNHRLFINYLHSKEICPSHSASLRQSITFTKGILIFHEFRSIHFPYINPIINNNNFNHIIKTLYIFVIIYSLQKLNSLSAILCMSPHIKRECHLWGNTHANKPNKKPQCRFYSFINSYWHKYKVLQTSVHRNNLFPQSYSSDMKQNFYLTSYLWLQDKIRI